MKRGIGMRELETEPELQLGALLATLNPLGGPAETNEPVLRAVLDSLPWPLALTVWAPLGLEAVDAKGMARVADALRQDAVLCKALQQVRGWQGLLFVFVCAELTWLARAGLFAQMALAPGALGKSLVSLWTH